MGKQKRLKDIDEYCYRTRAIVTFGSTITAESKRAALKQLKDKITAVLAHRKEHNLFVLDTTVYTRDEPDRW